VNLYVEYVFILISKGFISLCDWLICYEAYINLWRDIGSMLTMY